VTESRVRQYRRPPRGVGGVRPDAGSGIRGLIDRVDALDGSLDLDSPPGSGRAST
jgi:hypothetical protein